MPSEDCYRDIGPRDADVIAVAWSDPDVLVPVERGSFETWAIGRNASHRVAFTHNEAGEHHEGLADDVFGLMWIEDGKVRRADLGQVPPGRAPRLVLVR